MYPDKDKIETNKPMEDSGPHGHNRIHSQHPANYSRLQQNDKTHAKGHKIIHGDIFQGLVLVDVYSFDDLSGHR